MRSAGVNYYCSPGKSKQMKDDCLSLTELKALVRDFNKANPSKKIKITQNKQQLRSALIASTNSKCDAEYCVIDEPFVTPKVHDMVEKSFRPIKPKSWYKNPRTWLNTYDILNVMKQYEQLYKDFMFMGVYPIDFREKYFDGVCIGEDMCNFSIKDFITKQKKKQFSMVLNLDKHDQPGSHWVAVYCNLKPSANNFGIYYYDSVAYPPGREVRAFFDDIQTQVKQYFATSSASKFKVTHNTTQRQFKNTECGMFSMIFITQMLKNINFDFVCQHTKRDDAINELRNIIYRPSKTI